MNNLTFHCENFLLFVHCGVSRKFVIGNAKIVYYTMEMYTIYMHLNFRRDTGARTCVGLLF